MKIKVGNERKKNFMKLSCYLSYQAQGCKVVKHHAQN